MTEKPQCCEKKGPDYWKAVAILQEYLEFFLNVSKEELLKELDGDLKES